MEKLKIIAHFSLHIANRTRDKIKGTLKKVCSRKVC